ATVKILSRAVAVSSELLFRLMFVRILDQISAGLRQLSVQVTAKSRGILNSAQLHGNSEFQKTAPLWREPENAKTNRHPNATPAAPGFNPSFEVAHTQVYGYGFRPYEFSSLKQDDGASVSMYRQRELELGMHSMRSALYPRFYVIVSLVAAVLGADIQPFVLWKASHAIVSSFLPLSIYRFVSVYFRSHDSACLAAILVTLSTHLNVLGTHPLLNSFLAPGVFWSLASIHPLLAGRRSADEKKSAGSLEADDICEIVQTRDAELFQEKVTEENNNTAKCGSGDVEKNPGNDAVAATNGCVTSDLFVSSGKLLGNEVLNSGKLSENVVMNGNGVTNGGKLSENGVLDNGFAGSYGLMQNRHGFSNGKCLIQNGKSERMKNGGQKMASGSEKRTRCAPWKLSPADFFSGFVLSICTYIRLDVALFACITLLPTYSPRHAQYRKLILCGLGACAGLCVGVYEDFLFYGEVVVSPGNWAKFNVFQGMSSEFFGKSEIGRYLTLLFADNLGLCLLGCICIVTFLGLLCESAFLRNATSEGVVICKNNSTASTTNKNISKDSIDRRQDTPKDFRGENVELKPPLILLASCVLLLLFYSSKAHKELRFIHNVIVLMFAGFASTLSKLATVVRRKTGLEETRALLIFFLILFASSQWSSFPSSRDQSNTPWSYQRHWDSHDVNACLHYVGRQNDVTGVFVDRNFHVTGGYSLVHHDVPLFTLLVYEFVEFSSISKIVLPQSSVLGLISNVSFVTLDRISNYVSVQNAAYLVRLLIENTHYNYFVMSKDRRFVPIGFSEVYTQGTMRVMKRNRDPDQERQLQAMAARTPVGVNATVLRYEGDVLFRFQRFRLAAERYQTAL
ncbi:hypothetical protein BaRGS_00020820, partial [Batillaria attramentaria]